MEVILILKKEGRKEERREGRKEGREEGREERRKDREGTGQGKNKKKNYRDRVLTSESGNWEIYPALPRTHCRWPWDFWVSLSRSNSVIGPDHVKFPSSFNNLPSPNEL